MNHSYTAETGFSISDQVQKTVGKKVPTLLLPERMKRIERLHKKYRDGVRKGIIVPRKYKAPTTPGRSSAKPQNRRILNKLPASSLDSGFFSARADSLQPSSFSAGHWKMPFILWKDFPTAKGDKI